MYPGYNVIFRLTFGQSIQYLLFLVLFICFTINYDIGKEFNVVLSFPDQATPLTLKNNLKIILGSNPEKFKNF